MFPEVPVTTIAEVPAGVPPGVGGGSTVEAAPPPQDEQNGAPNIAALGQTILITLLRWPARGLLELNQKIIHAARNATAFQEFCSGLMRNDSGQANEPERLFVVTTTEALEACVPSNVTEDGDTVQVESAGAPEQLNTTT